MTLEAWAVLAVGMYSAWQILWYGVVGNLAYLLRKRQQS